MRIISQAGISDVDYENVIVSLDLKGELVKPLGIFVTFRETNIPFASYSTEAKAIKAMQMLRESYAPHIDLKLSDVQKDDLRKFGAVKLEPMQDVEYQSFDNYYFQFPKDEEIEV